MTFRRETKSVWDYTQGELTDMSIKMDKYKAKMKDSYFLRVDNKVLKILKDRKE